MTLPTRWERVRRGLYVDLKVLGFACIEYFFLSQLAYPPGHTTGDRVMLAILLGSPYVLLYVWRLTVWLGLARWAAGVWQGRRR